MHGLRDRIEDACKKIHCCWSEAPRVGLICGSGLAKLTEGIQVEQVIPYEEIPHFVTSTAMGHVGQLVCGRWQQTGMPVLAMQGRFHFYEGYSLAEITFPVRVMHELGIELLMITSASGGMQPHFQPGHIVVIDDHINLMGDNPLAGWNDDQLGPRFPDMSAPYDEAMIEETLKIARNHEIAAERGVYVGVKGPNYETRAEYRFFRAIGGDVVGMSTVPETLVAVHAGIRVVGLSTVTNVCLPDALQPVSGEDVISAADYASNHVAVLIDGLMQREALRWKSELF